MSPRVSAGFAAGMKLRTPKGYHTRPTSARVREAVMSQLNPWLKDSIFIDLFAGCGSMGLEALSRGAREAYFIEESLAAQRVLQQNCEELLRRFSIQGLPKPRLVRDRVNALEARRPWKVPASATLVYADPPYALAQEFLQSKTFLHLLEQPLKALVVELPTLDLARNEISWPHFSGQPCAPSHLRRYGAATTAIWWYPREDTNPDLIEVG